MGQCLGCEEEGEIVGRPAAGSLDHLDDYETRLRQREQQQRQRNAAGGSGSSGVGGGSMVRREDVVDDRLPSFSSQRLAAARTNNGNSDGIINIMKATASSTQRPAVLPDCLALLARSADDAALRKCIDDLAAAEDAEACSALRRRVQRIATAVAAIENAIGLKRWLIADDLLEKLVAADRTHHQAPPSSSSAADQLPAAVATRLAVLRARILLGLGRFTECIDACSSMPCIIGRNPLAGGTTTAASASSMPRAELLFLRGRAQLLLGSTELVAFLSPVNQLQTAAGGGGGGQQPQQQQQRLQATTSYLARVESAASDLQQCVAALEPPRSASFLDVAEVLLLLADLQKRLLHFEFGRAWQALVNRHLDDEIRIEEEQFNARSRTLERAEERKRLQRARDEQQRLHRQQQEQQQQQSAQQQRPPQNGSTSPKKPPPPPQPPRATPAQEQLRAAYVTLGLADDDAIVVTPSEVSHRYRVLSLKWHPDRWSGSGTDAQAKAKAEETMKAINNAVQLIRQHLEKS